VGAVSRFPKRPVQARRERSPLAKLAKFVGYCAVAGLTLVIGLFVLTAVMMAVDPGGFERRKQAQIAREIAEARAYAATPEGQAKEAAARVARAQAAAQAAENAKQRAQACDVAKVRLAAAQEALTALNEEHKERERMRDVVSNLGLQAGKDTSNQYWTRVEFTAEVDLRKKEVAERCK
jgi:hypothetical protein